ncbi:MAG: hypothetical protein ABIJ91_02445, partial [Candidatus Kuenenbacteria bacterium]
IHINSGHMHTFERDKTNGFTAEDYRCVYSWTYQKREYENWMRYAPYPHTFMFDGEGDKKNNFYWMRFLLGTTIMGDGYFSYSDIENCENHHCDKYYDEFDLNLGYPTGNMQQLVTTIKNDLGVWVRFFDNGAVIVNIDKQPHTITEGKLSTLTGYKGPYYRFLGGQDPDFNNGQIFDEVDLTSRGYNNGLIGDAIFLVKEPTTVVADIIVDNVDMGTSPASETANLEGEWEGECSSQSWSMGCRGYCSLWDIHFTTSFTSHAIFTPTIGVAGNYAIYEWHGNITNQNEATNVRYIINYSGQSESEIIDQSQNQGQWNKLGIYNLSIGTNNNVTISAQGSNGTVIADAIRFVYQGNKGNIKGPPGDYVPPTTNTCSSQSGSTCESSQFCDTDYLPALGNDKCCPNGHCMAITADLNCSDNDNRVNFKDLVVLVAYWGNFNKQEYEQTAFYNDCGNTDEHIPDMNGDGKVGLADFTSFLSQWGK